MSVRAVDESINVTNMLDHDGLVYEPHAVKQIVLNSTRDIRATLRSVSTLEAGELGQAVRLYAHIKAAGLTMAEAIDRL